LPDASPRPSAEELIVAVKEPDDGPMNRVTDDDEPRDIPPRISAKSNLPPDRLRLGPFFYHHDAALFSYTAGVLGAAAFMALAIGPGWLGFLVSYLPASILAAWAGTGHD
jgi:hypothetical protein